MLQRTLSVLAGLSMLTSSLLAQSTAEETQEAGKAIIVLDASGSMWGQIEGKHKIEIAREVVGELMETLPENLELGLMTYGHRRKGDCTDIELLIPPGKVDRKAFMDTVMDIMPIGKTPLTDAVEQAATVLRIEENPASIILVSDGIETCDKDPCELAQRLAAKGIAFKTHVVAFDLTSEESDSIRCLAEETGGKFLEARDAETLKDALEMTLQEAAAPTPVEPEMPAEDLTPAELTVPEKVKAGTRFEVSWTGRTPANGDNVTIVPAGADEKVNGNLAYTKDGSPVELLAPIQEGPHEVLYRTGRSQTIVGRAMTEVVLETASLEAPAEVVAGSPIEVAWEGPGNKGDYITIVREDSEYDTHRLYAYAESGNPAKLKAIPEEGMAEILYVANQKGIVLARREIRILPALGTVAAPEKVPAGSEFAVQWTGPDNQGDFITITKPDDGDRGYGDYKYTADSEGEVTLKAPDIAGEYEVRYTPDSGDVIARVIVEVTAVTATLEAPETVQAGADFKVTWTGPDNNRDYITVVKKEEPAKAYGDYFYPHDTEAPGTLRMPETAGEYELRYVTAQTDQILARRVITAGAIDASIDAVGSAEAGSTIKVAWIGPNNTRDFMTVVKPDAKPNDYGTYFYTSDVETPGELRVPETAGDYELRYVTAKEKRILTRSPLKVTAAEISMSAPSEAAAGAEISVEWMGPNASRDFITVVPVGSPPNTYGKYFYTQKVESPGKVRVPEKPGACEVRYVTGKEKKVIKALPINVTEVTASVTFPAEAPSGSKIEVSWEGPNNPRDYITVIGADEADGAYGGYFYPEKEEQPARIKTPELTGEVEVRYVTGGSKRVLFRETMTLTPITATLKGPSSAAAGSQITVEWTGPVNERDFVNIVKKSEGDSKYGKYFYAEKEESPTTVTLPDEPGEYEIRYVTGQKKQVLARVPLVIE